MNIGTELPKKVYIGDKEVSNIRVGNNTATYQDYTILSDFGSNSFLIDYTDENVFAPYRLIDVGTTQTTEYIEISETLMSTNWASYGAFINTIDISMFNTIGLIASSPNTPSNFFAHIFELIEPSLFNYNTYLDCVVQNGENKQIIIPATTSVTSPSASVVKFIGFQKYPGITFNKFVRYHYIVGLM
jgi:hypothetical protein